MCPTGMENIFAGEHCSQVPESGAPLVIDEEEQLLIGIGSVAPFLSHLHSRLAFLLVLALQRNRALLDSFSIMVFGRPGL